MVANVDDLKNRVVSGIESLPEEALAEVVNFVEYQRYRAARHDQPSDSPYRPVALGGLWAGHDLTEEEIDEVRREIWAGFGDREL